jgi:hypothetical protein
MPKGGPRKEAVEGCGRGLVLLVGYRLPHKW